MSLTAKTEYTEPYFVSSVVRRDDSEPEQFEVTQVEHRDCIICGAAVADTDTHDRWHDALRRAACRG